MKKEMDLTGKNVLVVGTGVSGVAAAGLLKKKGVEKVYFLTISIGQGY